MPGNHVITAPCCGSLYFHKGLACPLQSKKLEELLALLPSELPEHLAVGELPSSRIMIGADEVCRDSDLRHTLLVVGGSDDALALARQLVLFAIRSARVASPVVIAPPPIGERR